MKMAYSCGCELTFQDSELRRVAEDGTLIGDMKLCKEHKKKLNSQEEVVIK